MADMVKGFMDRITNEDPESRGQQLWVMFALSIFLVATLNYYAYVREPDVIEIGSLLEYKNEVVKVEGTLVSWVEDPYSSGDDRLDAIVDDGTGVVEVRWFRPADMPPIGTTVTASGDVIEYDGRVWLQSLGAGAMEWSASDIPDAPVLAIADVAANPQDHEGTVVRLKGYLSKSIGPDATFTSAYLGDHPNYGNSEHQMHVLIRSSTGTWIEAHSKVTVQGILTYQQRDLRWSLSIQGPDILIDRQHEVDTTQLDWAAEATWSYQSGQQVSMAGTLETDGDPWMLSGPGTEQICVLPTDIDQAANDASSLNGTLQSVEGRLLWSTTHHGWCIDANEGTEPSLINPETPVSLMALLSASPQTLLDQPERTYTLSSFIKYTLEPSVEDEEGYVVDAAAYTPGWTTVATTFPGPRTQWLEAGQSIVANVTVAWDDEDMRIRFIVNDYTLGNPPEARTLLWDDGATQWGYARDQAAKLNGRAAQIDGEWHLVRPGSNDTIRLNPTSSTVGIDELHADYALTWQGRLRQMESADGLSMEFVLDQAAVSDMDGDGLADGLEEAIGTSPSAEDSDNDGINDRTELENANG